MLNKFKYKDWNFVEYLNPKKIDDWHDVFTPPIYHDGMYKSKSNDEEGKVFERIIDWFKHIEGDDSAEPDEIWDSLDKKDRAKWFKGSRDMFFKWWDKLPPKLKYYYTDRIMSDKPMLPDKDLFKGTLNDTEGVKVTIIDKKLAITSEELPVLDNIKSVIEDLHGWVSYEHRTKVLSMGRKIHTYIFDLTKK